MKTHLNPPRIAARAFMLGIAVAFFALITVVVKPAQSHAKDEPGTLILRGVLNSRPAGNTGIWVIAGRSFTADANTQFDTLEGPLNAGACAKVRYFNNGSADIADEIDSEPASDCGGTSSTGTPSATGSPTPAPSATAQPGDSIQRGIVNSRPVGKIGTWVVGGRAFVANIGTQIDEVEGALVVGACAKVRYGSSGGVDIAGEIDSEPPSDCGLSGTPAPQPSGTPGPTGVLQIVRGVISSRPTGLLGVWVVGGRSFTAANDTEFDITEGPLNTGACAKVRFFSSNGLDVADEIDSEPASDCSSSGGGSATPSPRDSREDSKVYAAIDAFPAAPFVGVWKIGGADYQASSSTRFEQERGVFAAGVCVKAEFVSMNGVATLREVETEPALKCQVGASDPTRLSSSYGVIDAYTTTKPSIWVVSGISYTVNASTTLQQNNGAFKPGAFVEVKYLLDGGQRIAIKIETHIAPGSGSGNALGVLSARPSDDWSTWVIDGVAYQGDTGMRVELPASAARGATIRGANAGTTVQVNFYTANGVNYATLVRAVAVVYLPAVGR